jgi:hypothetical protein
MEIRNKGRAIKKPKMGKTVTPLSIKPSETSRKNNPAPILENLSNRHIFSIILSPF